VFTSHSSISQSADPSVTITPTSGRRRLHADIGTPRVIVARTIPEILSSQLIHL